MTSDEARKPAEPRFRAYGVGMALSFLCPACAKSRQAHGRRLVRFQGLRQYLCAECVERRK